ncbi:hypothetical protein ACSSS7_000374 [Eimeria intestinalis]
MAYRPNQAHLCCAVLGGGRSRWSEYSSSKDTLAAAAIGAAGKKTALEKTALRRAAANAPGKQKPQPALRAGSNSKDISNKERQQQQEERYQQQQQQQQSAAISSMG